MGVVASERIRRGLSVSVASGEKLINAWRKSVCSSVCGIEILGFRSIAQQSTRAEPSGSFLRLASLYRRSLIVDQTDDHPSISNGDHFLLSPPPFSPCRWNNLGSGPPHSPGTRATFGRVSKYARVIGSVKDAADCVGLLKQGLQSCTPWKNTHALHPSLRNDHVSLVFASNSVVTNRSRSRGPSFYLDEHGEVDNGDGGGDEHGLQGHVSGIYEKHQGERDRAA